MKRTAVTLGIAIGALVAPGAASATGVIQNGFGSSPGSVRPLSGIIVNGIGTSPGLKRVMMIPECGLVSKPWTRQARMLCRTRAGRGLL